MPPARKTPEVCPLCGVSPLNIMDHLTSHAPKELCQRCDGKEKSWKVDLDGVQHFRPDISVFYCSNCGRYAPMSGEEVS
jgi:hypothetical protein